MILRLGQPAQQLARRRWPAAAVGSAPVRARRRRPRRPGAGRLERRSDGLPHVRLAPGLVPAPRPDRSPAGRGRSSAIASSRSGNGESPSRRDSITSSHQRSGSSYPAAAASRANGSCRTARRSPVGSVGSVGSVGIGGRARQIGLVAVGAGQGRGGGQVAERDRDVVLQPPRSGPAIPGRTPRTARTPPGSAGRRRTPAAPPAAIVRADAAQAISGSASAGPSIRTTSGSKTPEGRHQRPGRSRDRGAGCRRSPARCPRRPTGRSRQLSTRVVELRPLGSVADHHFEILRPGDPVARADP